MRPRQPYREQLPRDHDRGGLSLLVGLGSFAAAGSLLLGLLCYDAFWVFGSGYVFGDGTADSNVMMAVATSDAFQGPFRLLFPRFEDPLNPQPIGSLPFSLLGLGDVAVPGLLACLALRYDASRATDMRGRATAAAAAFMSAFDDAWAEADATESERSGDVTRRARSLDDSVADRAARAAEEAFDGAADALGDTTSGPPSGGGNGVRGAGGRGVGFRGFKTWWCRGPWGAGVFFRRRWRGTRRVSRSPATSTS